VEEMDTVRTGRAKQVPDPTGAIQSSGVAFHGINNDRLLSLVTRCIFLQFNAQGSGGVAHVCAISFLKKNQTIY
jgi:hypothetical protein